LCVTGVFDPLNQGAKGPAPPLEQKSEDRYGHRRCHIQTHTLTVVAGADAGFKVGV